MCYDSCQTGEVSISCDIFHHGGKYENQNQQETEDTTSAQALDSMELERILRLLREENPVYAHIVMLRAEGYTVDQIAQKTGISVATVTRYFRRIRDLALDFIS